MLAPPVHSHSMENTMKQSLVALLAVGLLTLATSVVPAQTVKITENKEKKQYDVSVDGQPFTSYVFWDNQKKPILYPLRTAKGTTVTRGFPLEKVAGERTDHPHHISSWFNYGNINGVDFWNTPPEGVTRDRGVIEKFGTIKHRSANIGKSGKGVARLDTTMDWIMPDGSKIMQEDDQIFFRAARDVRIIDRIITLTAQDKKVVFNDSKEGALGIRVTRTLEEPSNKPEVFTDANGVPTKVPVMDNTGVAGVYLSSEGKVGEKEAWGTRAKWMTLSGTVKGEDVVIGIFDHRATQADYDELRLLRLSFDHASQTLGVRAVQHHVDFVECVDRSRCITLEREHEGERRQ